MKRTVDFTIKENMPLTASVYEMTLAGDTRYITAAGQFVNVALDGLFLRRPISVCDVTGDILTLVYKVVGKGTDAMSKLKSGDKLNILTGLGNGYDLALAGERPLLIGGGVGVPPLYLLAKRLLEQDKKVTVILGFNTADEIFYEKEFLALGAEVRVTTADGSYGRKGFVTDAIEGDFTHYYACGPLPMLKAVSKLNMSGSLSLEERMGCGFGACMGCSIQTKNGVKRVCKEGPVFDAAEVIW